MSLADFVSWLKPLEGNLLNGGRFEIMIGSERETFEIGVLPFWRVMRAGKLPGIILVYSRGLCSMYPFWKGFFCLKERFNATGPI